MSSRRSQFLTRHALSGQAKEMSLSLYLYLRSQRMPMGPTHQVMVHEERGSNEAIPIVYHHVYFTRRE
jgi:hypothetical protein